MIAVMDASALLALLQGEPGADRVAEVLPQALISAVNLSEVAAKLADKGIDPETARTTLELLALNVVEFDTPQAMQAGLLRVTTRAFGLSLGDRACLALAARSGCPALTTDRDWARLDVGIDVNVIR